MKPIKLLELFAGSKSIGTIAEQMGMSVFSVDWSPYENIDLVIDIEELETDHIPFVPDIVWLSPDCSTYSVAAVSHHRKNGIEPLTDYAIKCDNVNKHWIALINKWLEINPNMVYFIENPRGMLRKMPFMQEFTRHTVWYCQYGEDRAKPTDIWTNSKTWIPRAECHNGNRDCHHQPAPRGSMSGSQAIKGSYNRAKIPTELCVEVLNSVLI
ncbi:MAG TPA: hypothetical protein VIV55_10175 [Flavobacterium sp.]